MTRVLLFFDQFLLACAVESILMQEADLTILKHTPGASPLLTDVERFRPNVIITDAAKLEQANLGLLDLIRGPLALRILFVADDEDLVLALEKKEIPIRGSYDLIQAIRS